MKQQVGIWIDHKDAFLVFIGGVERHVQFSDHHAHESSADDQRQKQRTAHLATYYDEVISHLDGAESILLFGPGEAKGELEKRIEGKGLGTRIVGVETADRMTGHQISAKVREHYQPL